eukprot:4344357-Prymnesium_polylepis.1
MHHPHSLPILSRYVQHIPPTRTALHSATLQRSHPFGGIIRSAYSSPSRARPAACARRLGPQLCGWPIWDLHSVPARYDAEFRG